MYAIKVFCLLVSSQAVSSTLDIEEMKSMKYGIEITNRPVLFNQPPIDNMVHVSSKYGQLYQCRMPFVEVKHDESKEKSKEDSENIQESIAAILDDSLKGECLYYTRGWWTYKFCYKDVIQQYHEDENGINGNVLTLGIYDSEKDWKGFKVSKKKHKDKLFHQHKYLNGSMCDLTERFRQSTVKFFCDDDGGNRLVKVEEPSTCTYLISVYSAHLCKHPLFKAPEKQQPKEIICSPALSEDQFSKYLEKNQVKPSIETIEKKPEQIQSNTPTKKRDKKSLFDVFQNFLSLDKHKASDNAKEIAGESFILKENIEKDSDSSTEKKEEKKEEEGGDSINQLVGKEAAKAMRALMESLGLKTDTLKMYGVDAAKGGAKMTMKGEAPLDTGNVDNNEAPVEIDDKTFAGDNILSQAAGENEPTSDSQPKLDVNDGTDMDHLDHPSDVDKIVRMKRMTSEDDDTFIHKKEKLKDKTDSDRTLNSKTAADPGGASVINKFASQLLTSAEKIRDAVDKNLETTKSGAEELRNKGKISEASEKLSSVIAMKKRLDDLDAFTVTLLERDREMRDVINNRYQRNRLQIQKEIKEMNRLHFEMQRKRKRIEEGKEAKVLDRLIAKTRNSVLKYSENINKLDEKMQQLNELGQQMDQKFGRVLETNKKRISSSSSPNIDKELNSLNVVLNKLAQGIRSGLKDVDSTSSDKNGNDDPNQLEDQKGKKSVSSVIKRISKLLQEEKLKKKDQEIISKLKNVDESKSDLTDDDKHQEDESNINIGKLKSKSKSMSSFDDRIKVRVTTLDDKDVKKIFDDDSETDVDKLDESDTGLKGKLRRASKKMEEIVKSQLEDAGLKIGSNIRVKILTNRDQLKKIEGDPNMQVLSETETNQFKDMILSLLGGGHEQVKVKKQQKSLEDNYKFQWNENEELSDTNKKRTEKEEDVLPLGW